MQYSNWGNLLYERFPIRSDAEVESRWIALKQRLVVGQSVVGVVFARAPFGAWIDLGVGFPALLEIICIADLTPEQYSAGDWCPIGSQVTAFIGGFRDNGYQIRLWQVRPGEQKA